MPNLDGLGSTLRDLWNRNVGSSSGPPPPAPAGPSKDAARPDHDAHYAQTLAQLPDVAVALPAVAPRVDPVAAKLDELQATLKGPYTVMHFTIESGAQFRMSGGFNENHAASGADAALLQKAAATAGVSGELALLRLGRGDPKALVKLTQALIDAGQLSFAKDRSLPAQIHDLQWRFGIGIDCAGYVYRAVVAVHGDPTKLGLKPTDFEDFTGLPQNPKFRSVTPAVTRAGDVLVLTGGGHVVRNGVPSFDPGHNLIVRSHALGAQAGRAVVDKWSDAAAFLAAPGVHVLEVDSSFGAHAGGDPTGGVRRDMLLYNEQTREWCTCYDVDPRQVRVGPVPYGERAVAGFFRPKGGE